MGIIKVNVADDVESAFRRIAMRKFGYRKGALSIAVSRAIYDWAMMNSELEKVDDPVGAIFGMLRGTRKSSVELQHEAGGILSRKYAHRR
jgi:hypothetical protein